MQKTSDVATREGWAFFNGLSGTLGVELSEEPKRFARLSMNEYASSTAKVKSISLEMQVYLRDNNDEPFRSITPQEMEMIVYEAPSITLRSEGGGPVVHVSPNGKTFSVKEMIQTIIDHEKETRGQSNWFGGVDVHHVYYEGLHPNDDGSYTIYWGS